MCFLGLSYEFFRFKTAFLMHFVSAPIRLLQPIWVSKGLTILDAVRTSFDCVGQIDFGQFF